MKLTRINNNNQPRGRRIVAADEEDFGMMDDLVEDEDTAIGEQIDDIADDIEDMQDDIDEVTEDETSIEVDNNITGHYIAECDKCKGVFISAIVESDEEISSVKGVCPLCDKESEQFLKWIIKDV